MFHCRRLLSRVDIPALRHLGALHRNSLDAIPTPVTRSYSIRHNVQFSRGLYSRDATSRNISRAGSRFRPRSPKHSVFVPRHDREVEKKPSPEADEYAALRLRNRNLVANLPTSRYMHVLRYAFRTNTPGLANHVVQDLLEIFQGEELERVSMLQNIMSGDIAILDGQTIVLILRHLEKTHAGLKFISTDTIDQLLRMMLESSSHDVSDRNRGLLELLYPILHPLLLVHLRRVKVPGGSRSITYVPPKIVFASFRIVHRLLTDSYQQQALDVFQVLVKSGQIPPEILQGLDSSSNDFKQIVCSALIKASLHWNWRTLAMTFMADLIESYHPPDKSIIDLNTDAIYALLDTPTPNDIKACGHLMRRIHDYSPVSDSIVRLFYNNAAQQRSGEAAEIFFAFANTTRVLETHTYPPPQGAALPFLLHHLSTSQKKFLSRRLAEEVADNNLAIPLEYRAKFIATVAAMGYGTLSRRLWEKYAAGEDRAAVVGNSALMVRMVRLFTRLSQKADVHPPPPQGASVGATEAGNPNLHDLSDFRDRVLAEYRKYHEPLAKAHHYVLTSLARASFIVGDFTEGTNTFKILVARKEIPDLHDINVTLTALAEVNLPLADEMVNDLDSRGHDLDPITFSTVLHHALLNRDTSLAQRMIKRIRRFGSSQLTMRTIATLLRAHVSGDGPQDTSKSVLRSQLAAASSLVESLPRGYSELPVQTGKLLVEAALRAEDPGTAYRFWRIFLRQGMSWDDRQHSSLRRIISQTLNRRSLELGRAKVAVMRADLRMVRNKDHQTSVPS